MPLRSTTLISSNDQRKVIEAVSAKTYQGIVAGLYMDGGVLYPSLYKIRFGFHDCHSGVSVQLDECISMI